MSPWFKQPQPSKNVLLCVKHTKRSLTNTLFFLELVFGSWTFEMDNVERWKISLSLSPFVLGVVTLLKGRRELEWMLHTNRSTQCPILQSMKHTTSQYSNGKSWSDHYPLMYDTWYVWCRMMKWSLTPNFIHGSKNIISTWMYMNILIWSNDMPWQIPIL